MCYRNSRIFKFEREIGKLLWKGPRTFFGLAAFERRVERSPDRSMNIFQVDGMRPRANAAHLRRAIAKLTVSRRACGTHKTVTRAFVGSNPAELPTTRLRGRVAAPILRVADHPPG